MLWGRDVLTILAVSLPWRMPGSRGYNGMLSVDIMVQHGRNTGGIPSGMPSSQAMFCCTYLGTCPKVLNMMPWATDWAVYSGETAMASTRLL